MAEMQLIEPRVVQAEEMLVMGIEVRTTNQKELYSQTAKIPELWHQFFAQQVLQNIPHPIHPEVLIGVYTNYLSDHLGEYSVVAAVEVASIDNPPEGMVGIPIPAGAYLVFTAQGEPSSSIVRAWKQVWRYFETTNHYDRAYTVDFERYTRWDKVEIHIAVCPKGRTPHSSIFNS